MIKKMSKRISQKEKAIEYMRILGIDEKLINAYRDTNKAIIFDDGAVGVPIDERLFKHAKAYAKKLNWSKNEVY